VSTICVYVMFKLIDMLDQRVKSQHEILVHHAVNAARTNEMQLESDVLRAKLAELRCVLIQYCTCLHLLIARCSDVLPCLIETSYYGACLDGVERIQSIGTDGEVNQEMENKTIVYIAILIRRILG